jgi:hypothetical protein
MLQDTEELDSRVPEEARRAAVPIEKRIIRRQMNRSGNTLISALEPLDDDEFFAGAENGISAAWTVGHIACVTDLFTSWLDTGGLLLPRSVHDVFNSLDIGKKSGITKAETVDRTAYPKGDLLLMLRQSQVKALRVLDRFDVRRWESPAPEVVPDTLPTCGAIWEHLSVHTYWHLGELSGCLRRFHGTYTMNSVLHYFFAGVDGRGG